MSENKWYSIAENGSVAGMWFLALLLKFGGYWVARFCLYFIVAWTFIFQSEIREASRNYLAKLHAQNAQTPRPNNWNVYRHMLEFAVVALERACLWCSGDRKFSFEIEGRDTSRKPKEGLLIMGAHLGSFEALRGLANNHQVKVHVVMHTMNSQKFLSILRRLNKDAFLRILENRPGSLDMIYELQDVIARKEHVAILADRMLPNEQRRASEVTFLGETALLSSAPWILPTILRGSVVLCFGIRTGARQYRIIFEHIADPADFQNTNRDEVIQQLMTRYVCKLEELCHRYPLQWFNFYDFWKKHE